ncbi:sensor histidine kinase [Curvibacter gracilis]|uniref:sensor histidine kinase n=1 Tax=Curvibacter gracilis TaxID=230310 RepID=UPI000489B7A4|nr:sensor histidine kinase [Curvibacter gracilis]
MPDRSRIAFRTFLILALLLVLLPIVVASGWFFYRSALSAREEFAQQLADEVSSRVREKIVSFFDVPLRVVTFNVEQARAGQLLYAQPEALMRQFLLQIDQQPQLTFISMGLADGQYYAGSRPPVGADRPLQLLRARIADGRAMEVLRLDEASRALVPVSRSEIAFDARSRPWFQSALARDGMAWYAPYRYLINDAQGAYAAIGMGVSAPVRDRQGALVGVVTADVALSQINEFLARVARESGGQAFLADENGALLASSTPEPGLPADGLQARKAEDSADPVLRAVGRAIRASGQPEGNRFIDVGATQHLARWWTQPLHNGPSLTLGVILPESRFNTPLRGVLHNTLYLTLAVMLAALLFSVHVANRVVSPLARLGHWAGRLTRGEWHANAPAPSPIRELGALSDAMRYMARHLQEHAQDLEQTVTLRTRELKEALLAIEQTLTDQRHFIAMLSHEVRSPLAVIHTTAQLMCLRAKDSPSQLAQAERILRGAIRLNYFFDNCLTQDRIDSDSFVLEPAPIDVPGLMAWVLENGLQLSPGHPLQMQLAPGLPALHGDQVLLRIMLMNLVSNAFKYSPEGAPVALHAWQQGDRLCLAVDDAGPGIPPEEAELVFDKYRRGRGAEGKPGAGLGLALVRRIAQLHGGRVWLEAREPQGSRFVIELPLGAGSRAASAGA